MIGRLVTLIQQASARRHRRPLLLLKTESCYGTDPAPPAAPLDSSRLVPQVAARTGWHALPGFRLEYRDTGFYIALASERDTQAQLLQQYQLHTPENVVAATGPFLSPLQDLGERMAAERAAFLPAAAAQGGAA